MIELHFRGGNEFVFFKLDRSSKTFILSSSRTGYAEQVMKWKMLFDPGREILQEATSDRLSDEEFIEFITANMKAMGYAIVPPEVPNA